MEILPDQYYFVEKSHPMPMFCSALALLLLIIVGFIVSMNKQDNSSANTEENNPYAEDQIIEDIVQLDMIDDEWEDDR